MVAASLIFQNWPSLSIELGILLGSVSGTKLTSDSIDFGPGAAGLA